MDKQCTHSRIIITNLATNIDCGRFPIKRCVNEEVIIDANIFADGHDQLGGAIKYHHESEKKWQLTPLQFLGNDQWQGKFSVTKMGLYVYTLIAWVDYFQTWRQNLLRWLAAKEDIDIQLQIGADIIERTASKTSKKIALELKDYANKLRNNNNSPQTIQLALSESLNQLMQQNHDPDQITCYPEQLKVIVDPPKAQFSSWYEIFPRSWAKGKQHGTFKDITDHLPYIASMGFDVLYLTPIHPIGDTYRKGKNNTLNASNNDVGSPWAIGSTAGGHKSIHPQLGSLKDFQMLIKKAKEYHIEIALDYALQCSPDHPYVQQHPEWFQKRPDGSIQYAENPPKKYQDIYPFNFNSEQWHDLWQECKDIFEFWIKQGVKIFRVDNPHTKPFAFWEWVINAIKKKYPEVIFLSEAFTRPQIMYHLAKVGFSQSYTYFTWRTHKKELIEYFEELTQTQIKQYFRPNLWPNTPDILHEFLQQNGRAGFIIRLILAATLSSNYGIYGPCFELCIDKPREPHSEEYLDSEKYEIKDWDLQQPQSLKDLISKINNIRKKNSALQNNCSLQFHSIDNEYLISYSKTNLKDNNIIIIVVNLDPNNTQSGWLHLPLTEFGIEENEAFKVHDLVSEEYFRWQGLANYVELNPKVIPAHILKIET